MVSELAGDQWNEGDVSCSVVRRVALPDAFFATDGLFQTFLTVLDEFGAYPAVIARELVESMRRSITIDWTMREDVRARMRVLVKRILRKYGYPPDKSDEAVRTVIAQAEASSRLWAA